MAKFTEESLLIVLEYSARALGASEEEIYDFTRCVRPDGSVYGSRGKCKKGTEAGPAPSIKGKTREQALREMTPEQWLQAREKEWNDARMATYRSMRGWTKQQVLNKLNEHRKIHGSTIKDSMADLKHAVLGAIYGNESPMDMHAKMLARQAARDTAQAQAQAQTKKLNDSLKQGAREAERASIRREFAASAADYRGRIKDIYDEVRRNGSNPELEKQLKMWAKKLKDAEERTKG